MSHTCSSALVRCIDFRLTNGIDSWMREQGIMDDTDIVSVAGVSKEIAKDPGSEASQYILGQLALSKKLHDINILYLIHHTDCGAYGGRSVFESDEAERTAHLADMEKAKVIITKQLPGVEIKLALYHTDTHAIELF